MARFLFVLIFFIPLFAIEKQYILDHHQISIQDIEPSLDDDRIVFSIPKEKSTYSINSSILQQKLYKMGIDTIKPKHLITNFIIQNTINLENLKDDLEKLFLDQHPFLDIKNIQLQNNMSFNKIPKNYTINIRNNQLSRYKGSFNIQLDNQKRIFFKYEIEAYFNGFLSAITLNKNTKLNNSNTIQKSILFKNIRTKPIFSLDQMQSKQRIKNNTLLTTRNTLIIPVVKKGDLVKATIQDGGISIEFSAIALQNAKINDVISIKKENGKQFRAKVLTKNTVLVQ